MWLEVVKLEMGCTCKACHFSKEEFDYECEKVRCVSKLRCDGEEVYFKKVEE